MRKIVFMVNVSVDGFFEGPHHELDWSVANEETHQHFNNELRRMGGFLTGRVTHELMAAFWPTADQDPNSTPAMIEFGRLWLEKPKIVYSRTRDKADWNATLAKDVVPAEVQALKEQPGGDLLLSGPNLAETFRQHDLIDEYWLHVHPVILGRGRPLFQPTDARTGLQLVESRPISNGVVLLRYQRPA